MKVVLITGCSSGIGLALAKEFLKYPNQYIVFVTARKPSDLSSLQQLGLYPIKLDVTSLSDISAALQTILTTSATLLKLPYGRIDILINNAGIAFTGPLIDQPFDEIEQIFKTNVLGPISLTQQIAPLMISQRSGLIINVSSLLSLLPTPFYGIYSASKAALNNFSEQLRRELKPFNINVVTLMTGAVDSRTILNNPDITRYQNSVYYNSVIDYYQKSINRASMSVDQFASILVSDIIQNRLTPVYYLGKYTFIYRLLSFCPRWLTDLILPIRL